MKLVFHRKYYTSTYASDPAASPGRIRSIMEVLDQHEEMYEKIVPKAATKEQILRAHTREHYNRIERNSELFDLASLAAGGSILAAQEAFKENPTFAVIRPPGHHASAGSCWGFCYFNNMSISLLELFSQAKIQSAFILDFDLHTGDGNINILENRNDGFKVKILNPDGMNNMEYIQRVRSYMEDLEDIDIFAASAGFDQGKEDWGHLLTPEDYTSLGAMMKEFSEKLCKGRRYAILEGGYNHDVLGHNVQAFCEGFQ
jgi:acetoin utilization deacetylase AcuC-like enzyme